jgi:hypothetical protein
MDLEVLEKRIETLEKFVGNFEKTEDTKVGLDTVDSVYTEITKFFINNLGIRNNKKYFEQAFKLS